MDILTNRNRQKNTRKPQKGAPKGSSSQGLSARKVSDWVLFALFIAAIGVGYIWNAHYAERQVQRRDALRKEVKDLRDRYYLQKADRQAHARFTEIAQDADTLGLRRPTKPPFRLIK